MNCPVVETVPLRTVLAEISNRYLILSSQGPYSSRQTGPLAALDNPYALCVRYVDEQ